MSRALRPYCHDGTDLDGGEAGVREPGRDLGRPLHAVAVDDEVTGHLLLHFRERSIRRFGATVADPDGLRQDRRRQWSPADQLARVGDLFEQLVELLLHQVTIGSRDARLMPERRVRPVRRVTVDRQQVLHRALSRVSGASLSTMGQIQPDGFRLRPADILIR